MNKRIIRPQNTRTKNKTNINDNYQNQTDYLGLQQIHLHNHNLSIFLNLLKLFAKKRFTQILNRGISALERAEKMK